ncbi:hypothetical protein [Neolewinella marina]|uniref:Peptidase S74 domain-containing protein n=1 Tax=Neolewinella marina TaxID=438751 RepID=A0A2G0CEA6_9BACT|nr:hypothetical protein [Neolewinella marina]PHK98295.1 hypothetical protein CGL56_11375 [Neolewinella marina]
MSFSLAAFAQGVPEGMKYQAAARGQDGQPIADRPITLDIRLRAGVEGAVAYHEQHFVTTNNLGLFDLIIGGGEWVAGAMEAVPWGEADIFLELGMDETGGTDFGPYSSTRLLSVPYAFYAAQAGSVNGGESKGDRSKAIKETGSNGSTGNTWKVGGNKFNVPGPHYLGTLDSVNTEMITNNTVRLVIRSDGDVDVVNTLNVGIDANIGQDVNVGRDANVGNDANIEVDANIGNNANIDVDANIGNDANVANNANIDVDANIGNDANIDNNVNVGNNANITNNATIGNDLEVHKNARLNTMGGETLNDGDFTVTSQSSSLLSGSLTVDRETDLNASLNVDGPTNLNSLLNVNFGRPTLLTGILTVNQGATFNQTVVLDNPSLQSLTTTDGALVVAGGFGLGGNLNVGGDSKFGGHTSFAGAVDISDLTQSTDVSTGALKVGGGIGLGKNLNVGGNTGILGTLDVTRSTTLRDLLTVSGATQINNSLGATGLTRLTNNTQSTTTSSGALVVNGGTGIGGNLNVGGALTLNGAMKLNSTFELSTDGRMRLNQTGDSGTGFVAKFRNTSNGSGIAIQVGAGTPTNTNDFVTFLNNSGGVVGRIEGESTAADFKNNLDYQTDLSILKTDVVIASIDELIALADVTQAATDFAGSATSSTGCAGLGACVTAPIPSLISAAGINMIVQAANLYSTVENRKNTVKSLVLFETNAQLLRGVTFASGAGDYAEYLEKVDPLEELLPGQIVGMKNGRVSLTTAGADRVMVVSRKPAVLGALPAEADLDRYEKIAFLGQVQTLVMGIVEPGDYIIPSGFHNGFGIGKKRSEMHLDEYDQIMGVAWEGSTTAVGMVNVAIGLNNNDLTNLISQQQEELDQQEAELAYLRGEISGIKQALAGVIPGYGPVADPSNSNSQHTGFPEHIPHQRQDVAASAAPNVDPYSSQRAPQFLNDENTPNLIHPQAEDIVYYQPSREDLKTMIVKARAIFLAEGGEIDKHPFWARLESDPNYQKDVLREMEERFDKAVHYHNHLNEEMQHD